MPLTARAPAPAPPARAAATAARAAADGRAAPSASTPAPTSAAVSALLTASIEAAVAAAASAAPAVEPLGRETLADRLATLIGAQITSGELAPGNRLPTEAQLVVTHGVSRSVVREAVHRLKSRGLLLSRQGSGVYVAEPARHQPLEFDAAVLDSVDAVVHVVEVRRVLEGEIAALAAARATRAQVAGLRRALAAIDAAAAAGADGVAEDLAFHRAIGEATGNPQFGRLLSFLEQYLREGMRITRGNEARRSDFMDAVRREHRRIVDAIAAGDAAAARRAATQHLVHGARRLERGGVIVPRGPGHAGSGGAVRAGRSRAAPATPGADS